MAGSLGLDEILVAGEWRFFAGLIKHDNTPFLSSRSGRRDFKRRDLRQTDHYKRGRQRVTASEDPPTRHHSETMKPLLLQGLFVQGFRGLPESLVFLVVATVFRLIDRYRTMAISSRSHGW